ncbi:MAG: protein kinase [Acidobacteriota bacterium]|nr:protein kinase [Acidobacteriota bacterium]
MTLAPGTRLGTYDILAPIGAGGMGEVYRARDIKLDRDVAIKVLPPSFASNPDAMARFEREAKSVAALSHPNILAIFDFGREDGATYAVMELLEGDTLRGRLEAGPLAPALALDYALQIARGLAAAHEKSIVHRDLKPENIFLTRDGHLKILDFGLAKRVEPVSPDAATSGPTVDPTEPGTVMGTVGYMSPEQVRGLPLDQRSDIFSFGAILYEMLSGRRAFRRETASDTMAAVMRDEPPDLIESGRAVPVALDHVVRHCLEKDRANRFQTARDVVFALGETSSSTGAAAHPTGSFRRTPKRSRIVPGAAAGLALLLVAGALLLWRRSSTGGGAANVKRIAVLPFENQGAAGDDYFADGVADAVRGKLTSLGGIEVIARASSTPYKKTSRPPQEIARELDTRYLLTATVRWSKGGGMDRVLVSPELVEIRDDGPPASRWQQSYDAPLTDIFKVQSEISSRVAQELGVALGVLDKRRLSVTPTGNLAAYDAFLKGEAAGVGSDPASQRKALAFYEQALALDPGFVQAWARVSSVNSFLYANSTPDPGLSNRARQAAEKAIALAADRPEGHLALGSYRRLVTSDLAGALEEYRKAERLSADRSIVLAQSAVVESELGSWDAAVGHLRESERLDPRSAARKRLLGQTLVRLRRYGEAKEAIDRGLALAPGELALIEEKALAWLGEGDLAAARRVAEAAYPNVNPADLIAYFAKYWDLVWLLNDTQRRQLLTMTPSAFDDDRASWGLALAESSALAGDTANLRSYAEEARKAAEAQLRATPDDPDFHTLLGVALAYLGRKPEARAEGERAVALQPVDKSHVFGPYLEHQLARIEILTGEPERAIGRIERLLRIPYYLSPGRLRVDPNFDALRDNPRFRKLLAGGK